MLGVKSPRLNLNPRSAMVLKNALAAGVLKGGSLIVTLAMIPAYIAFFEDKASLGAWLTCVSLVNWFLTVDFGIGNGMRNSIVGSIERGDVDDVRARVAGAYGAACAIVLVASPIFIALIFYTNWASVVGASGAARADDLQMLVAWLALTMVLQFVLRTVTFILYALQRSVLNNVMALTTSLCLLAFVLLATSLPITSRISWLGPAFLVCVNAPLALATLWVFSRPLRECRPDSVRTFWIGVPDAVRAGRLFFANQLMFTALLGTSSFMVAKVAGSAGVVEYQAHYTLFGLVGVLAMLGLTPLWSAVTQAIVVGDFDWVLRILRRIEGIAVAASLLLLLVAAVLRPTLVWWLGPGVVVPTIATTCAFVLFGVGFLFHGVVATFAAGLGKLKLQLSCYGIGIVLKVVVVWSIAAQTKGWALVPAVDGAILLCYSLAERISVRRWLIAHGG